MSMKSDLPSFREGVSLAPFTTLGVGGPARHFIECTRQEHVAPALEFARALGLPLFVLGGGSNVVIADGGFPGVVLRLGFRGIQADANGRVTAAAGEDWDAFVAWCVDHGWAGIECLSGIPGLVGATPVQNVGAYGQDVSETIVSVRLLDRLSHQITDLVGSQCRFSYRSSVFNTEQIDRCIILSVTFALRPGGEPHFAYADLAAWFARSSERPSLEKARQAVLAIRAGKGMVLREGDPDCRSAGSFFRNPVVTAEKAAAVEAAARRLGNMRPADQMPRYALSADALKIPAAWLLERAGFRRGIICGQTGLSSKHALALINRGNATASEILNFARTIQGRVRDLFGVDLAIEPVLVGFQEPDRIIHA